ncbi:SDR family NAD(P)-dependent oxidoreductase [Nocardioides sp.]|uniref:SDR family NAD(P)-dependent oxidoreductase n=1 Tax=Nocardioides sp. TaxID=35761 RepID=UPI003D0D3AD9
MSDTPLELAGKVALVTGAARGQGASHAVVLARAGAHVILTDVLDEAGEAVAASLDGKGDYLHLDVASEEQWTSVISSVRARWGRLDILVNNAGIMMREPMLEASETSWRRVLDINVLGAALGIRHGGRLIADSGGGSIVNISSQVAVSLAPLTGAYTASKWALRGMTQMAAKELGELGIRVNALLPGIIETDMVRDHMVVGAEGSAFERNKHRLAVPRLGQSEDVSDALLFIVSSRASYITGTDLLIDGGWTLG